MDIEYECSQWSRDYSQVLQRPNNYIAIQDGTIFVGFKHNAVAVGLDYAAVFYQQIIEMGVTTASSLIVDIDSHGIVFYVVIAVAILALSTKSALTTR